MLVGKKISQPKQLGGLGFRTARETNICLLGKLVWDMVQSSPKLWVQLLSDRYVIGLNALFALARPSVCFFLSSILHARDVHKDGFS